jgi:hypothetical protein
MSLTEGEADFLLALCARVGGDPAKSPRKYMERIYKALSGAVGYGHEGTDASPLAIGHVEFGDYGDEPYSDEYNVAAFAAVIQTAIDKAPTVDEAIEMYNDTIAIHPKA